MNEQTSHDVDSWLEQAFPQMHHLLRALDGSDGSLDWLKDNSPGVSLLVRALDGKHKALAAFHAEEPAGLEDLFELIDNEDLAAWLRERRPDLFRLFGAAKGGPDALAELKRTRPALARFALVVRELYGTWEARQNGEQPLTGESAAEVSCLVGEMHLRGGRFHQAVEAFSRAIETRPAVDLYEGRARAYRALAEADERRAREVRVH